MLQKRTFIPLFLAITLTALLLGQIFSTSKTAIVRAQTSTPIDFPDMTQLSPDGQKVLYVTAQNLGMTGATIWLANADLSQATALVSSDTNGAYWVTNPIWSPDGQKIAYVKAVKENVSAGDFAVYRYEIWVISNNGTNNQLVENTFFHPIVGYGGKTTIRWISTSEIEFPNRAVVPAKQLKVNVNSLVVSIVSQEVVPETLPNQASITNVPFYYKSTSPWGTQHIGNNTACATLSSKGGAITATAMTLRYVINNDNPNINPGMINNTAGQNDAINAACELIWENLGNANNISLQTDKSFLWRQNEDVNEWRANVLLNTKREISAGVPVILWYWLDYEAREKKFLTAFGFNGDTITAHDPSISNGSTITHDFYDPTYPIEGVVIYKQGGFFSKISPGYDEHQVNPNNASLDWNTYLPTPYGYRYCFKRSADTTNTCGEPGNNNWTGVSEFTTHVLLPNLIENTQYTWQVQANLGPNDDKITSNIGQNWIFTTGAYPITPTPTIVPSVTPTHTPTSSPYMSISGDTDLGNALIAVEYCADDQFTGCSSSYSISSDNSGYYYTEVPRGSYVILRPYHNALVFSPVQYTYANIQQNHINKNYTVNVPTSTPPASTRTITGNVGLANVTFDLCDINDSCSPASSVSGSGGSYSIVVPVGWTGTVIPYIAGYLFTPESASYTNIQANQTQNYTYSVARTISGHAGTSGVTLSYVVNGITKATGSNSMGDYSIRVPNGWTGTITPSSEDLIFSPANSVYSSSVTADIPNQNYILTHTFKSILAQDGWVLESGETSNSGGSTNSIATIFRLGDDATNRQFRAILSFATGGLADTAIIQSAVVRIKQNGAVVGTDPFTILGALRLDMCNGPFGTSALELTDFISGSAGSVTCTNAVTNFGTTPTSGWYSATLPPSGQTSINVGNGVTQFRLRFHIDDDNDNSADYMNFISGDFSSSQPELVVTYITSSAQPE